MNDTEQLAQFLRQYAPHDGAFELPVLGLKVHRYSRVNVEPVLTMSQAGLCLVAQGAKRVMLGEQIYQYDPSNMVLYSATIPVAANIVKATQTEPYLAFTLDFEQQKISELLFKIYPNGFPRLHDVKAIKVGDTSQSINNAALRIMQLMATPDDAEFIVPLIIDEILIRLLRGPYGQNVAHIGAADSSVNKVMKSIAWIQAHYVEALKVDELSNIAGMSPSAFHHHFKAITSMSPLQFQKTLRLQEARHLMMSQMIDVGMASARVGYASPSQFSREYTRHFGLSPRHDINRLKNVD